MRGMDAPSLALPTLCGPPASRVVIFYGTLRFDGATVSSNAALAPFCATGNCTTTRRSSSPTGQEDPSARRRRAHIG